MAGQRKGGTGRGLAGENALEWRACGKKKPTSNGGKREPPKPIGFRPLSFQARQTERERDKFDSRGIFLVIPVMKQGRTTDHQRRNGGEKRLVRSVNCYYVTSLSRSIDRINATTKDFVEIFSGNYRPHLLRLLSHFRLPESIPSSLCPIQL